MPTAALPAPCAGSYLRTALLPRTDVKFCLASLYCQCSLKHFLYITQSTSINSGPSPQPCGVDCHTDGPNWDEVRFDVVGMALITNDFTTVSTIYARRLQLIV